MTIISSLLESALELAILCFVISMWVELRSAPRLKVVVREIGPRRPTGINIAGRDEDDALAAFRRAMRHLDREDGRR